MQPLIRPCFERIYDCISQPIFSDAPARPKEETQSISSSARRHLSFIANDAPLLAEGGGFEPPVELPPHNLSKVAPSTTRTPLQSISPSGQSVIRSLGEDGARGGTRTRTHFRAADFESAAAAITPPWLSFPPGAGEGNRTLVASLEGWSSAIELRPLSERLVHSIPKIWYTLQP